MPILATATPPDPLLFMGAPRPIGAIPVFPFAIMPNVLESIWAMVFARGRARIVEAPPSPLLTGVGAGPEMEFLRTLPVLVATEVVLSRREPARGRLLGV